MGNNNSVDSVMASIVNIAIDQQNTSIFSDSATVNSSNVVNFTGCSCLCIEEINQMTNAGLSLDAYAKAVQTSLSQDSIDQLIENQVSLIAQSLGLGANEARSTVDSVTNLTKKILNTASASCAAQVSSMNVVDMRSLGIPTATCFGNTIGAINQTAGTTLMSRCVMDSIQASSEYTDLKQKLQSLTKLEVKDSLMSVFWILMAVAAILMILVASPGIAAGSLLKGMSQGGMKQVMVYLMMVLVIVAMHWYLHRECVNHAGGYSFFGLFTFPPSWCHSQTAAGIAFVVVGMASLFMVWGLALRKRPVP